MRLFLLLSIIFTSLWVFSIGTVYAEEEDEQKEQEAVQTSQKPLEENNERSGERREVQSDSKPAVLGTHSNESDDSEDDEKKSQNKRAQDRSHDEKEDEDEDEDDETVIIPAGLGTKNDKKDSGKQMGIITTSENVYAKTIEPPTAVLSYVLPYEIYKPHGLTKDTTSTLLSVSFALFMLGFFFINQELIQKLRQTGNLLSQNSSAPAVDYH